jgi:hypothetical protein
MERARVQLKRAERWRTVHRGHGRVTMSTAKPLGSGGGAGRVCASGDAPWHLSLALVSRGTAEAARFLNACKVLEGRTRQVRRPGRRVHWRREARLARE